MNLGLCGEKPATNCVCYSLAIKLMVYETHANWIYVFKGLITTPVWDYLLASPVKKAKLTL
jgi:hypothetical protein